MLLILGFNSCNPFAIQGPEAAFINIPAVEFSHPLEQGPRQHEINHVEIFFENFSIGYYELPVFIAVIPTMTTSPLTIRPAIEYNGGATDITAYTMMKNFAIEQEFITGETYEFIPQFDYKDNVVFDYVETFEFSNTFNFNTDEIDSTQTSLSQENAAEGQFSCKFGVDPDEFLQAGTNFSFADLANANGDIFVEFEYISDLPAAFGITAMANGESFSGTYYNLNPRSEWNKIYLDIKQFIVQVPAEEYKLYFEIDGNISSTPSSLFIDNIKLLHIP